MNYYKPFLLLIFTLLLLTGCTSTVTDINPTSSEDPKWMKSIPVSPDFLYGIGSSTDLTEAKQKSIIDAGQQFSMQVKSVFQEETTIRNGTTKTVVSKIDELLTDQVVYGAKFIDQFQDEEGYHWVLTKAPMVCMLDLTESLILSYSLKLKQSPDELKSTISNIENKMLSTENRVSSTSPLYRDYMFESVMEQGSIIRALKIKQIPDQRILSSKSLEKIPWENMYYAYSDPADDQTDNQPYSDISKIYISFDSRYFYIKVMLHNSDTTNTDSWYQSNIWKFGDNDHFFDVSIRNDNDQWITDVRTVNRNQSTQEFEWKDLYRDICQPTENGIIGRVQLSKIDISLNDIRRISTYTHNQGTEPDFTEQENLIFVKY